MRTTAKTRDFPIIIIIIILRSREGFTFSDNKNRVNVCGSEKKGKGIFPIFLFSRNTQKKVEVKFKGAVSRNSAKSGYCKMLVKLKEI